MTPLMLRWVHEARRFADAGPLDSLHAAQADDTRTANRQVVVGGVVDGRREKPGVLLFAITDDGVRQALGVSHVDHATAVISALRAAWPACVVGS